MKSWYKALGISAALLSQSALASSPGASGLFASADDAGIVASNPAGMSRLPEGSHLSVQLMAIQSFSEFEVDENQSTNSGGDPDNDLAPIAIPSIYYVSSINEDWRWGWTVNVPSGFGSSNGGDWSGRYYSDSFTLVYVAFSPALSYRVNEKLSLGGAINFTYNYSESTSRVNNVLDPGVDYDGEMEFEAGSVGINATVSMLYEFNEQTRMGLVYAGEATADLEGDLDFKKLGPNMDALLTRANLKGAEIEVENILPQRVQFGIHHELQGGNYFTFDTMWIDFSQFGTGQVSLEGTDIVEPKGIYDDLWFFSAGYGIPVSAKMTYKFGLMHLTEAVDDDDRTLGMRLDEMWGIGAGFSRQLEKNVIDVNVNLIRMGKGKVDTGPSLTRGRVVGESETPYALMFDLAYHW